MQVWYEQGDILASDAEALVNTVNCEGVMGKGLALQFRRRYAQMNRDYVRVCREGNLRPGQLHSYREGGRLIINFPTKDKWRNPSRMQYIEDGLQALKMLIEEENVRSIAIPPLGCGLGGLSWDAVRPMILQKLADIDNLEVHLYGQAPRQRGRKEPVC